jgi:prepilin-type N-terminal cleavage/methylation domain-containing protein
MKETMNKLRGFTLIELLIVIAILGVLAAALIATVDPFEQIKKARDTKVKELTVQFLEANVRYYSNHNGLAWQALVDGGANCYTGGTTLTSITLTALTACLQTLVADGELKQSFTSSTDLGSVMVTNPNPQTGNASDSIACFLPQSKSQQKDANTKFNQNGSTATACKSQGGTTNCYWCAQ